MHFFFTLAFSASVLVKCTDLLLEKIIIIIMIQIQAMRISLRVLEQKGVSRNMLRKCLFSSFLKP